MREIFFRGKSKDNGEWVCGDLIQNRFKRGIYIEYYDKSCIPAKHILEQIIPETIGQYTGLEDKNGKMIFEGDIVCQYNEGIDNEYLYEYRTDIGRVFWYNAIARFLRTSSTFPDDCPGMAEHCEYEVIGNAYDNPELLKGEE